eukprot:TRINITY_DN29762_c0_g1_i1.p1 TRINITY_DN29762_c0_g1~~TRINITY_DN29762_c0_g1_i1.p1  ORF type:complete len:149 (-),score=41.61 TRINITY_DN29762_c0_g1_i1:85-531(-)
MAERKPLPDAAFRGNALECARLIDEQYADVNEPDEFGWTPLHRACESGSAEVVQVLLSRDADVDILTPAESTAFHVCCLHGQLQLAEILIEADDTPNINDANMNGITPLHAAAFKCMPDMISLLLKHRADPHCSCLYTHLTLPTIYSV